MSETTQAQTPSVQAPPTKIALAEHLPANAHTPDHVSNPDSVVHCIYGCGGSHRVDWANMKEVIINEAKGLVQAFVACDHHATDAFHADVAKLVKAGKAFMAELQA